MSRSPVLATGAITVLVGFALVAMVLLSPDTVLAEERAPPQWVVRIDPELPDPRLLLDDTDEAAALAAVQLTLSEVADGSTYVWYRANGRLSGQFKPTASFKDVDGQVCRHLQITLTAGGLTRATEGIACRLQGGIWSLIG